MSRSFITSLTLIFLSVSFLSCQKELSFEIGALSQGSLQGAGGECLPKQVGGTFIAGQALGDTNFIEVTVDVVATGGYTISTDTLNGYYFRATGNFGATGTNTIKLKGFGTPNSAGINDFMVIYDSTFCTVPVTVLPATGSGGTSVFTLEGAGGACANSNVAGTYTQGTPLTASNQVVLSVNVTTVGTWTVSSNTVTGMNFTGSGTFTTTGVQNITLNGTGTPNAPGAQTFSVSAGSGSCTFVVTVQPNSAPPSVCELVGSPGSCTGATVTGTYIAGTPLGGVNSVTIQVNVTTVGAYTISTNTVTGFSFTASGTFTTTGVQNVILAGGGTPTTAGNQTFTVTAGSSTCTFVVTVAPASTPPPGNDYFPRTANSNWGYEFDDVATDTIMRVATSNLHAAFGNNYTIFMATDDISQGYDSSGYFRRSGGNYYEFHDIGSIYGFDNAIWQEYIFLKDDQPANTSWYSPDISGTVSGQALTIREKFIILQKDVSVTVNGTAFPNTIVVEQRVEQFNGTTWVDVSSVVGIGKWYYSRGVGIIKFEFTTPSGVDKTEIFRYQVY